MTDKETEKKTKAPRIMTDAQGQSVPAQYVKPYDRERDRVARRIQARFGRANAYIAQVKADTLEDIAELQRFGQKDGQAVGGVKGNCQFTSFDGLIRVRLDAKTMVDFDDRFRQAQQLIFEYVDELTGATDERDVAEIIRAAFRPSAAGMLSKAKIMGLLRLKIEKPKWLEAMRLLRECQFVKSGKSYLYCEVKPGPDGEWENIPLDIAAIEPAAETPVRKEVRAGPADAQSAQ